MLCYAMQGFPFGAKMTGMGGFPIGISESSFKILNTFTAQFFLVCPKKSFPIYSFKQGQFTVFHALNISCLVWKHVKYVSYASIRSFLYIFYLCKLYSSYTVGTPHLFQKGGDGDFQKSQKGGTITFLYKGGDATEGGCSLVTARQDNVAEAGQTCLRMPRQDILSCLKCSDVLPRLNVLPR